ncbi:hypothetical protein BGX31_005161 [Mortierella sp. GBA43]|nr:hypothetical protein BGX31_005161 [Mortierella sp. GBA43]
MEQATSSSHIQYQSELERLKRSPVPYNDIYLMLTSYDTIPIKTLGPNFRKAASDSSNWIEIARAAMLGLEMVAKRAGKSSKQEVDEIETIMNRFQPNIDMMIEIRDKVVPRLESETNAESEQDMDELGAPLLTVTELQQTTKDVCASWTSLNTMLDDVKGIFANAIRRQELLTHMEEVLAEIEAIDKFQEEISHQTTDKSTSGSTETPSSPPLSSSLTSSSTIDAGASTNEHTQGKQRNSESLAEVDARIQSLTTKIEVLTTRIDAHSQSDPRREELQDQYQQLLALWAAVKTRRETIGEELKEQRWLAVFEQVSGQVGSMMESLDRAIVHCKGLVDQIKTMIHDKVVPSAPIDREHLYTIFKSFEAKHKYYAPAVRKMLRMLENGIEVRAKNVDIIQRHRAIKDRWEQLEARLDSVELDLDGIEEMLNILDASIPSHTSISLAQLPEKPLFSMRRPQTVIELKSPEPPALFQPPESSPQVQRGRRPNPSSAVLRSSMVTTPEPFRTRDRSPANTQAHRRPWSPAPSTSSFSSMLSPHMPNNGRSLSPSPSRSPSRSYSSDKPRPWCPSTKTSSPSIPGIPHAPSAASVYSSRSTSGPPRELSASPTPLSRSDSSMSRGRSTSCAATINGGSSLPRPIFSPVGSLSKLSPGAQANRSTSPIPGFSSGRRPQLKVPPPVVTNTPSRPRQNSAPETPTPNRRSITPGPTPRSRAQSAAQSSALSAQLSGAFSSSGSRHLLTGTQNGRSATSMGHRSHQETESAQPQRQRRTSLGSRPTVQVSKMDAASEESESIYGLGDNLTSGSGSSMRLEMPTEEPNSPSTSSSSSIGSSSRIQPSQSSQAQERQPRNPQLKTTSEEESVAPYRPIRGDELDEEFARIYNASFARIPVRRLGEAKYYFGGRVEERGGKVVALGGKTALCRLMEYGRATAGPEDDSGNTVDEQQQQGTRRDAIAKLLRRPEPAASRSPRPRTRSLNSASASAPGTPARNRKVMVRVGGGWQDLDLYLLDQK